MKIIHCADIHADSKMDTNFTKEQADERRNDIVDTFEDMVNYAKENEVAVILIAGDLFDTKTSQRKIIKRRISYIIEQNPSIDFLYLRGNHDEDVAFCSESEIPNLKVFNKDSWTKYSYENVDIYGREFSKSIPSSIYSELLIDSERVNIVTLHGQIAEYKTKDGAPEISLPKLINQNIDYIALGHIHDYKAEQLDKRCTWCYSGCLEGRGFDECGKKGFVVLNIENDKIEKTFISLSKRQIHEVFVELNGSMFYNEILHSIQEKIDRISANDIVQVVLIGEISEDTEVEIDTYQSFFTSRFYYIRFKDKTEAKIEYSKYENDVSLKGEFIRLVNSQNGLSEDEKSRIIMNGIKALAGRLK